MNRILWVYFYIIAIIFINFETLSIYRKDQQDIDL